MEISGLFLKCVCVFLDNVSMLTFNTEIPLRTCYLVKGQAHMTCISMVGLLNLAQGRVGRVPCGAWGDTNWAESHSQMSGVGMEGRIQQLGVKGSLKVTGRCLGVCRCMLKARLCHLVSLTALHWEDDSIPSPALGVHGIWIKVIECRNHLRAMAPNRARRCRGLPSFFISTIPHLRSLAR